MIAKSQEVHEPTSYIEMKKVSWPSLNELRGSTVVVIVTVIILSIFIGMWLIGSSVSGSKGY